MIFGLMRLSCSLGKMRSSDHARSSESKIVRLSYGPAGVSADGGEGVRSPQRAHVREIRHARERAEDECVEGGGRSAAERGACQQGPREQEGRRHAPWPTNCFSNLSRNSKASLSSGDRASSPTTAFIAAASRPIAYLAYYRCIDLAHMAYTSAKL